MPYVQSWTSLRLHAKLADLCSALQISRVQAIGHLHLLWHWTLEQRPTGHLTGCSAVALATAAEWPSDPDTLVDTLLRAGWLDRLPDGSLTVHDWRDYAGELLRKREQRQAARTAREEATASAAKVTPEPAGFASIRALKSARKAKP